MRRVRFYLVRHGKAEGKHPGGDAARRLSPEGRVAFAAHAAAVAGEAEVARIVTSPFVRARQTADLLSQATGAPVVEDPDLASGASGGPALLALARRLGDGTALVGHNPELGEAIALCAGHAAEVPPGTVAAVEAGPDGYRLAWLRTPAP